MSDLISRQSAIGSVNVLAEHNKDSFPDEYQDGIYNGLLVAKAVLEDLPSAEPVHGEWAIDEAEDDIIVCSECGFKLTRFIESDNYCPNCGAKMGGKE